MNSGCNQTISNEHLVEQCKLCFCSLEDSGHAVHHGCYDDLEGFTNCDTYHLISEKRRFPSACGCLHFFSCPSQSYVYNSTVEILGSKQQVGRTHTILTPLALCGPTFMNVAITEVSPLKPSGPMFASFTLRVISTSISF